MAQRFPYRLRSASSSFEERRVVKDGEREIGVIVRLQPGTWQASVWTRAPLRFASTPLGTFPTMHAAARAVYEKR